MFKDDPRHMKRAGVFADNQFNEAVALQNALLKKDSVSYAAVVQLGHAGHKKGYEVIFSEDTEAV